MTMIVHNPIYYDKIYLYNLLILSYVNIF